MSCCVCLEFGPLWRIWGWSKTCEILPWSPLPLFIPSKLTFPHSFFGVIGLFLAEKPCQVTRANLSLPFTNGTWFMVISFSQLFTSKESICYKAPSKALLRMQQSERRPLGLFQEFRLCSEFHYPLFCSLFAFLNLPPHASQCWVVVRCRAKNVRYPSPVASLLM